MTLHTGTKVKWGGGGGYMSFDGTIRGMSSWGNKTYYVIEDDHGDFYPRPEEWVQLPKTTLPEYVSAYVKHELNCQSLDMVQRHKVLQENLEVWVANAFEAYEGGAR